MTARKNPQDHKEPQATAAEKQERFDEIEGHELLVPIASVKGSDQLRLTGRVQSSGLLDGDEESIDFERFADVVDYVSEKFSVDPEKFVEFTSGPGGMKRAIALITGFIRELGNSDA